MPTLDEQIFQNFQNEPSNSTQFRRTVILKSENYPYPLV
jgi:hypothetical protein